MSWLTGGLIDLLKPLGAAAQAVRRAAARDPWRAIAIWFAIIFLVSSFMLHWARAENTRLRAAAAEIAKGQAQARRDQAAVNRAPAIISQSIAQESSANAQAYYDAGRRAGAAYADAHRVRASAPVCPASSAALPRADRPAAQHDGPGGAADLVAIAPADFDACTINSQRIAKVRADAEALIAAGVAVADNPTGGK